MAKFKFKEMILKDLREKPYTISEEDPKEKGKEIVREITIAETIQANLNRDKPDMTPDKRYECYLLAKKIKDNDEVDLTIEELALIKKVMGEHPNPLIQGRVWDVLEQKGSGK